MSSKNRQNLEQRLLSSVDALINGEATRAQVEELESLFESSEARTIYLEYISLHTTLRKRYLAGAGHDEEFFSELNTAGDAASPVVRSIASRSLLRWRSVAPALAAAALLGVTATLSVLWFLPNDEPVPGDVFAEAVTTSEQGNSVSDAKAGVAVVTRLIDVELAGDVGDRIELGHPCMAGRLEVVSGLVQLEFYCGATIILEGPASFDLVSTERGFIHNGKLRAHVPAPARGFTIGTETGDIVDLGTEFAIELSTDGNSEVHVFDGEVDYYNKLPGGEQSPQRLLGGQGLEIVRHSESLRSIQPDARRFIGPAELNALTTTKQAKRYRRWREHRSEMQADPTLIAHYTFDDSSSWGRTLFNRAPGASELSSGAIVGCNWSAGRWPGQQSLKYESPSHRVRVNVPGTMDAMSAATWLFIEELEPIHPVALLYAESEQERTVQWLLDRVPTGAVLHFAETYRPEPGEAKRFHYSSMQQAIQDDDLRRWIHLAVVYDPQDQRVTHYIDGQAVGWKPIEHPRPLGIGIADLGNWPHSEWAKGTKFEVQNLNGKMDEFAIWNRALTQDEVREMYSVGRQN